MYLKRKADEYLQNWKQTPGHKPLIIKGARQVGKTESIMQFANENYKNVICINFALEKKYRVITDDGYTVEEVNKAITRIDPSKNFIEGDTLLFFDEIQDYPDIATALKSYCLDGKYDVICSGSLLGIYYKKIESNSVGYKTDYIMRSMDFEEFLWAKGYNGELKAEMMESMLGAQPFSTAVMQTMSELFLDHIILGGMPAVVKEYIENGLFSNTLDIQKQLLADYEEDIMKYAEGMDQTRILNVFRHIPVQLGKENKKFQISKVASGARFKDYRGAIEWLANAGIINICYCLHYPELPLKGNYEETKYKIYMADTGLLVAMLDEEIQEDLRVRKNIRTYKGGLYENIIGDMLVKAGYSLYYYTKENSTLEEDFFVRNTDGLIPIEVKATNNTSKALSTLIKSDSYPDIHFGIKLISGNIGDENCIRIFPHFTTFLLKEVLTKI
ncbi:MAG: ATP-binding protein [Lachnospiraceae bacterium]|nr:ATP-binding protein [Lachnospiraceae bacterium]